MSSNESRGQVNLVVALSCEARPLIQQFNLRQEKTTAGFRRYGNRDGINLIVSGVGKLATATACSFLAGSQLSEQTAGAAWFNIGIAGHKSLPIGEGALIHKVTDHSSGRVSYPPLVLNAQCPTSSLITVEHPETEYREEAAYDMEASVFATTAGRFMTSELVQIYKIISDNPHNPVETVTEQRIGQWVEGRLHTIELLVNQIQSLASEYNRVYSLPSEFFELTRLARFTASQRVQLESVCRRFFALGGESLVDKLDGRNIRSAKELLARLETLVAGL